jgi:DNA anti-recombination protein RmuC
MAKKVAQSTSPVKDVQVFVSAQLEQAKKRIGEFEKDLTKRAKAQQKEVEGLLKSIRQGTPLKAFEKQASAASDQVKQRLEELQSTVLTALGVATSDEIGQIHRELTKLSKKVDALVTKKGSGGNGAEA